MSKKTSEMCLKMGLFNIFKSKDNRNNHTFTDEDRERAKEILNLKHQLKLDEIRLESELRKNELTLAREETKQQISELTGELLDDDTETNDLFTKFILPLFIPKQTLNSSPTNFIEGTSLVQSPNTLDKISLTDTQIDEVLSKIPKNILNIGKNMETETLIKLIKAQAPNLDDETISKGINKIRKR